MAYQPRPSLESRSPIIDHEQQRHSPWISHHPPQHHLGPAPTFGGQVMIMDPESEGSEGSSAEGDVPAYDRPIDLPPGPSSKALENQNTINGRLGELESIENHNIRKHNLLKEKRARMDYKINRKRAAQDAKIKTIMDARSRHDNRIKQRRDREDIAFQRFYEILEEEETRLRQRLKRLKRGLPVEESTPVNRRSSLNAGSPTISPYSTIPPPAKRHQSSHPSQSQSPHVRPPEHTQYVSQPTDRPPYPGYPPSYGAALPQPGPYHTSSPFQQRPSAQSPPMPHIRRGPPADAPSYTPQRPGASPHIPVSAATSAPISAGYEETPRMPSTSYDTRPPPSAPSSSGFAAVNHPSTGGFAAVNVRLTETPPSVEPAAAKDHHASKHSKSVDHTPARTSTSEEKSNAGNGSSKRTPSTTHPYQMSEAFANRHHHCERTDTLNRGIWTWYGPGGRDHPTEPATEMYLRCNHDGCRRIDWRTVHGLQCHIVKNHEQPKGTIGSLEKALAAYGVPISDIEETEKRDGLGSGGTMADPKNTKVRSKIRDSADRRDLTGRDPSISAAHTPLAQKKHPAFASVSPSSVLPSHRPHASKHDGDHRFGSESTPIDVEKHEYMRPSGGFAAVNTSWQPVNAMPSKRPPSRDLEMRDAPRPQQMVGGRSENNTSPRQAPQPFWPGWQGSTSSGSVQQPSNSTQGQLQRQPMSSVVLVDGSSTLAAQRPSEIDSRQDLTPEASADISALRETTPTEKLRGIADDLRKSGQQWLDDSRQKQMNEIRTIDPELKKGDQEVTENGAQQQDTHMATVGETTEQPTQNMPKTPIEQRESPKGTRKPAEEPAIEIERTPAVVDAQVLTAEPEGAAESPTQKPSNLPVHPQDAKAEIEDEDKSIKRSPEVITRQKSTRGSRRTSIATAASSKTGTEKSKDDEHEVTARQGADEDGDTITVSGHSARSEQREKERRKIKDEDGIPSPRLPNGRFTRNKRR